MRRLVRWSLQFALTVLVTVFLFRALRVSLGDVTRLDWARWAPDPTWLILSVACLLGVFLYLVALWVRLLRRLGAGELRYARAVRIFFLAQLTRYIPGKVWPVAGLAYLGAQEGVGAGAAAFSALLSQAFSLAAAFAIGSLYLGSASVGSWRWTVAAAAAVVVAVSLGLGRPGLYRVLSRYFSQGGDFVAAGSAVGRPGFALTWLGLHAVAWVGYSLSFCLLWAAFRPLPWNQVLLAATAFPAAYLLGYAAFFAPAGLGVREGALAALTTPVLGPIDATAFALIARVWMTLTELLPLAWLPIHRRPRVRNG